jgi:hypothetical protein
MHSQDLLLGDEGRDVGRENRCMYLPPYDDVPLVCAQSAIAIRTPGLVIAITSRRAEERHLLRKDHEYRPHHPLLHYARSVKIKQRRQK